MRPAEGLEAEQGQYAGAKAVGLRRGAPYGRVPSEYHRAMRLASLHIHRAGHTTFATTQGYVREAVNARSGLGEVFPTLPE